MKDPSLTGPRIGLPLLVVAATVVAWLWVPAGRATSDSALYLDGARHLAAGSGFASSHVRIGATAPRPIVDFPPGFPLLMVAAGFGHGLDLHRSAALVVGVSFVVYIAATYLLLLEASAARWPWLALLFAAVLMLHPGVLLMLDTIGSDLPAAALWMAAAALGFGLVAQPSPDLRRSIAIGILLGFAVLTRWSALYLAISLAAGLFLSTASRWDFRQRLRSGLLILLVPACVAGLWIARNDLATHTLFGYRRIRLADPLSVAADALNGLGFGLLTGTGEPVSWPLLGVTALLASVLLFVLASRRAWRDGPVRLALISMLGYCAILVLSASVTPIDSLRAPRFWPPVWPLLGAIVLGTLAGRDAPARGGRLPMLVLVLALVLTGGRFGLAFLEGMADAGTGRGFLKESLAASAPIEYARRHDGATLLSNDPRVVLIHVGVPLIHDLPDSAAQLRPLLRGPVAVLLFTETMTPRIAAALPAQREMLSTLQREGLVSRVAADPAGEVWVSASASPAVQSDGANHAGGGG